MDPKKNFKPKYVVTPTKKKILDDLEKAAEKADTLYVATDPDREGEAIGWHLAQELPIPEEERVPHHLQRDHRAGGEGRLHQARAASIIKKVDAQQARRVLDRLVGYSLSPLLWDKVQRGLSAGRVQSVAVRLIVDREREIQEFVPVEYWSLHANLKAKLPPEFTATLREVAGEKAALVTGEAHPGPGRLARRRAVRRALASPAASASGIRRRRSSPRPCSRTPAASSASRPRRR